MKNIELKISLPNNNNILGVLKKNKTKHKGKLFQTDTYFNCPDGRLKIREINNKKFEIIFYHRPDRRVSKISDYKIINLSKQQFEAIKSIFKSIFGEKIVVKKERDLWIHKNTRIHLDKVSGLGVFLELETVIGKININSAKRENIEVINLLGINNFKKIGNSYSDLLSDVRGLSN